MALMTIRDFATYKDVTIRAIEAAIETGRLKYTEKYGKRLVNSKSKYTPIRGRGRKKAKKVS